MVMAVFPLMVLVLSLKMSVLACVSLLKVNLIWAGGSQWSDMGTE